MEDPIENVEKILKQKHDVAGKYSKPVLKRYPLLFSFLLVFGVASILHGFELWSDNIKIIRDHPSILIIGGVLLLFFTGTLYKALDKMK